MIRRTNRLLNFWGYFGRLFEWELRAFLHEENWAFRNVSADQLLTIGIRVQENGEHKFQAGPKNGTANSGINVKVDNGEILVSAPVSLVGWLFIGSAYEFRGKIYREENSYVIEGRLRASGLSRVFTLIWWNLYFLSLILMALVHLHIRTGYGIPGWAGEISVSAAWVLFLSFGVLGYLLSFIVKAFNGGTVRRIRKFFDYLNS